LPGPSPRPLARHFALAKALGANADGVDEFVTCTNTDRVRGGRAGAALVDVRAGKFVELETFDDRLAEHTGSAPRAKPTPPRDASPCRRAPGG
jgi:hypothetical protein